MSKSGTKVRAEPAQAFQDAMFLQIAMLWQEVFDLLPKIAEGEASEAVHNARLATRRLRTAMDAAAGQVSKRWYRKLHRRARAITRQLGRMRDYDVMLDQLSTSRDVLDPSEHIGHEYLSRRIRHERQLERKTMVKRLDPYDSRRFRKEVRARFGDVRKSRYIPDVAESLAIGLRPFLSLRVRGVLAFEPSLRTTDDPEVFHQARIAVKKLRYALEIFKGAVQGDSTALFNNLKHLQDLLGTMHDHDVRIARLEVELASQSRLGKKRTRLNSSLATILDRQRQERIDVEHEVVASWGELMSGDLRSRLDALTTSI